MVFTEALPLSEKTHEDGCTAPPLIFTQRSTSLGSRIVCSGEWCVCVWPNWKSAGFWLRQNSWLGRGTSLINYVHSWRSKGQGEENRGRNTAHTSLHMNDLDHVTLETKSAVAGQTIFLLLLLNTEQQRNPYDRQSRFRGTWLVTFRTYCVPIVISFEIPRKFYLEVWYP